MRESHVCSSAAGAPTMSQILTHDGEGQDECALWAGAFCVCGNASCRGGESLGGPTVLVFAVGLRGHQDCKPSQPSHRVGVGGTLMGSEGQPWENHSRNRGGPTGPELSSPPHSPTCPPPSCKAGSPCSPWGRAPPPPPTAKPVSWPKFLRRKS